MHINKIIETSVRADVSRTPPMYRPSVGVPLSGLFCETPSLRPPGETVSAHRRNALPPHKSPEKDAEPSINESKQQTVPYEKISHASYSIRNIHQCSNRALF